MLNEMKSMSKEESVNETKELINAFDGVLVEE